MYHKQALDVELLIMKGGSVGTVQLLNGELDIMRVGMSSVLNANKPNPLVKAIGSQSNVIRFVFFSSAGISSASQLKGGVVGVSTFGSESDATATLALRELGLLRSDVEIREIGGAMARLAALKTGKIAAAALNEPVTSEALESGTNVLVDLAAKQVPWLFSSIVVRSVDLQERRELLKRFLSATVEANYFAKYCPEAAKRIIAHELDVADRKLIDINYIDFLKQSPMNMMPTTRGIHNVLAESPDADQNPDSHIDTSLLAELEAAGLFEDLKRRYKA
jgi:ABC-type nitrate/sulfonate/bicarbonate transport system substrate-binding protein